MNRTPRSASRRASRQFDAKLPSPGCLDAVEVEDSLRLALEVRQFRHATPASGTPARTGRSACAISGSSRSSASMPLSRLISSITWRCVLWHDARRDCRCNARRRPCDWNWMPWNLLGKKPADHCRADTGCRPVLPGRGQHDEAGQVLGLGAQAVEQPRAHARPALDDRAGCS